MYLVNENEAYFEPLLPETWNAMEKIKLLFETNNGNAKNYKNHFYFDSKNKKYIFKVTGGEFTGTHIHELIVGVNSIMKKHVVPLVIFINNVTFKDKLVYIVLECICYYLIRYENFKIELFVKPNESIWTEGIRYSPLLCSSDNLPLAFFLNSDDKHYRRIIGFTNAKTVTLSNESTRIMNFLKNAGIDKKTAKYLTETMNEVIGNAIEHGKSDCLVDIDITDKTYHKSDPNDDSDYYGINVAVLNFSRIPFHHKLQQKLMDVEKLKPDNKDRYLAILKAKNNHSKYFGKNYKEKDFYTISSFQNKISGSINKAATGGVGLTQLIKAIQKKSDSDYCYMLSENRSIYFYRQHLKYDKYMFISFNECGDYFNSIPHEDVLGGCDTYFPGTAYNLNFVIKL